MTIPYLITIGEALSNKKKKEVEEIIHKTFMETDTIYNNWNPNSELSTLNALPALQKQELSEELQTLFTLITTLHKVTKGRFDPTISPLKKLWISALEKGEKPLFEDIQATLEYCGWEHITIEENIFYKDNDLTSIDVGGVAKGLCIDFLVTNLNKNGYLNVLVDWGAELKASGKHPEQRPWTIAIRDPQEQGKALVHTPLIEKAIATSGDYMQQWVIEVDPGSYQTYSHIIDPKTGYPISNQVIKSGSVLASSCAFADGLATATLLFETVEKTEQWIDQLKVEYPELKFWLIYKKNNSSLEILKKS
jgi:FAD:protein FMN transferase